MQLTAAEVRTMKRMVEWPAYRHVPTARLAILARRLGKVSAAPASISRKQGVRASEPDGVRHVETTIIKVVDSTKLYLHAVLDNSSRKILA